MKKLIVITRPDLFPEEANIICSLFESGLTHLHIRKPGAGLAAYESLLESIPVIYRHRIRLHEYPEIADKWMIGGIHLNRRFPVVPPNYRGKITRSCHSLEELSVWNNFEYLFLSPVFSSLSKQGYESRFSRETLKEASQNEIIREHVIALGGMDKETIPKVQSLGFGGYAVLGAIWGNPDHPFAYAEIIDRFQTLQQVVQSHI